MYARTSSLVFAMSMLLFVGACGGSTKISTTPLNRVELADLDAVYTPNGLRVVMDVGVNFDLAILDKHIEKYEKCKCAKGDCTPANLDGYTVMVVLKGWPCIYHKKGCTAEISPSQKTIWLTRLNMNMMKHELAHLDDYLDGDDNFTAKGRKVQGCWPMTSSR